MAGEDQQPGGGEEGCLEGVAGEGRLAEAGEGPEAVNQVGWIRPRLPRQNCWRTFEFGTIEASLKTHEDFSATFSPQVGALLDLANRALQQINLQEKEGQQ